MSLCFQAELSSKHPNYAQLISESAQLPESPLPLSPKTSLTLPQGPWDSEMSDSQNSDILALNDLAAQTIRQFHAEVSDLPVTTIPHLDSDSCDVVQSQATMPIEGPRYSIEP